MAKGSAAVVSAIAVAVVAAVLFTQRPPFIVSLLVQPAAHSVAAPAAVRPASVPPTLVTADDAAHKYVLFDKLFNSTSGADAIVDHCMRHGSFRQYISERAERTMFDTTPAAAPGKCPVGLLPEDTNTSNCVIANRFDVGVNFVTRGGPNRRRGMWPWIQRNRGSGLP